MTRLRSRIAVAAAAALISFGILSGCGDDGTVTQQSAAIAAAADAEAVPATGAVPADAAADEAASTTAAADATPTATAADTPVETRAEILLLEGELLDGQQFDFAATVGNDVLLWFWAPW